VGAVVYRVNRISIGSTDWNLALVIPEQEISAFGNRTRSLLVLVLVVMLSLMVPVSLWAASGATRRLDHLLTGVRRLGEGGFDVRLPEDGRDEIAELTRNFNRMVDQIRDLVDERFRLGVEVKQLELRALQAQINPHFLYNTLDLINGLALMAGQPRIVETVSALSKFYRISLSGGEEIIPLAKEFEHAVAYVRIQNLRFDGVIRLETDLDPALAEVPVLKMVLQPLVENAILHGILEKPEVQDDRGGPELGTVVLRARRQADELVLEVEDDGVGMGPTQVAGLLAREPQGLGTGGHGYGVFNIDRRLKLRYGDGAGLRFEASPGRGTRVTIVLPFPW
jgi:two-component system sensor histidine kinase YesM